MGVDDGSLSASELLLLGSKGSLATIYMWMGAVVGGVQNGSKVRG